MPKLTQSILLAYGRRKPPVFDEALLYALADFADANFLQTALGGGEAGIASGFGVRCLAVPLTLGSERRFIHNLSTDARQGWTQRIAAGGSGLASGAAAQGSSLSGASNFLFVASDIHKIFDLCFVLTASALRFYVDGQQAGPDVAFSGFVPHTGPTVLGKWPNLPFTDGRILSAQTFRGVPTSAQILAASLEARQALDYPLSMAGATVTHTWSLRGVLQSEGVPVIDGQLAPAVIPDTTTFAAVDEMGRQGSPLVRVMDPSADGQPAHGVMGVSAVSFLRTAGGIRGSEDEMWVAMVVEIANPSDAETFVSTDGGWAIRKTGSAIYFPRPGNPGASVTRYTWTASDVGQRILIGVQCTATAMQVFVRGVQAGADGTPLPVDPVVAVDSMKIGVLGPESAATTPLIGAKVYALAGADGTSLTAAEWLSMQKRFERTGTLSPPAGKTQHLYDLTQDVLANGTDNPFPLQVLDRVGTDHLARLGGYAVQNGGLQNVEPYQTYWQPRTYMRASGHALPGNATGWWREVLTDRLSALPAGASYASLFSDGSNVGTSAGWQISEYLGDVRVTVYASGALRSFLTVAYPLGLVHVAATYDGSIFRVFVNGTLVYTSASGLVFLPPVNGFTSLGCAGTFGSCYNHVILGGSGGEVAATDLEIATAASAALAAGKVVGIPGKTLKRWSVVDDVLDAAGKVPAIARERVSGVDHMVVMQDEARVASLTQRSWSYEATPILHGADAFTPTRYAATPGGTAGQQGSGVWFALLLQVLSRAAIGAQYLGGKRGAAGVSGWEFLATANVAAIQPRCAIAGGTYVAAPLASIANNDVGKLLLVGGMVDPVKNTLRTFHKRIEYGGGSALTAAFLASSSPCVIGGRVDTAGAATLDSISQIRIFGMMCGRGVPSLAAWQSAADQSMADEDLRPIGGYTEHLWSIAQAVRNNGGTLPATISDQIGTDHMTVYGGGPTIGAQHSRIWGW